MTEPDATQRSRVEPRLPRVLRLQNTIRRYAWGSPTAIPELLGEVATGEPAAELWIGAHPDDPSRWDGSGSDDLAEPRGLDELIHAQPEAMLGTQTMHRFGARLPFLLKLLAAEKCLSLQVHPNLEQACAGFADEQARGVARDSPARNYCDPNHKPELLCALTDFEALCGFRPVEPTLRYLDALIGAGAGDLEPYRELVAGSDGLRAAFTALLSLSPEEGEALIADVVAACRRIAAAGGEWAEQVRAPLLAAEDFPGDIGAVIALLLNYVRLQPGQAIFLSAGNVHAYLRGLGVELLANSDNVLRCGLTPKHVDIAELLRIADFTALAEPRWPSVNRADGACVFQVEVPDFELTMLDGATIGGRPVQLPAHRPHVLLCTQGAIEVRAAAESVEFLPGQAAFIRADAANVEVFAEHGTAFLASVNI